MSCKACDIGCNLTDQDCLCTYSSMKGIDPYKYSDVTMSANFRLVELISEECADKLCEDGNTDILTTKFKRYYNKLWEALWLENYGSGQISKAGLKTKTGDEHEDFTIASFASVRKKLERMEVLIEKYELSWLEEFKENHSECFECKEDKKVLGCGCVNTCGCKTVSPHTSKINSKCGGRCGGNCGCSNNNRITGNIAVL